MTSAIPVRCSTNWAMIICTAVWDESEMWSHIFQFGKKPEKNQGFNRIRIDLRDTGAMLQLSYFNFPCSEIVWTIYEIIQASSFQLLKLENLLRWSHFTFTGIPYLISTMYYEKIETGPWDKTGWNLYLEIKSAVEKFWKSPRYESGWSICTKYWRRMCCNWCFS